MQNWNLYSRGDKLFVRINAILIGLFVLSTLYPFIYMASVSLSTAIAARAGSVVLAPVDLTFAAYGHVFVSAAVLGQLQQHLYLHHWGTITSLLIIVPGAYACTSTVDWPQVLEPDYCIHYVV